MKNKLKILIVFAISFLIVSGIFSQPKFLASTIPENDENSEKEAEKKEENSPSASLIYQSYQLSTERDPSMSINAEDNWAQSRFINGTNIQKTMLSTFTEGQYGSSETLFYDPYSNIGANITATNDNKTIIAPYEGHPFEQGKSFNATIDNGFNPHSVDSIKAYDNIHGGYSDVSASAEADMEEDMLTSFALSDDGDQNFNLEFNYNDLTNSRVLACYNAFGGALPWSIRQYGDPGNIFEIDILFGSGDEIIIYYNGDIYGTSGGSSIYLYTIDPGISQAWVLDNGAYVASSGLEVIIFDQTEGASWEIIIVWLPDSLDSPSSAVFDVSVISLVVAFSIEWPITMLTITINYGIWVYIFYLFVLFELLFVIIYMEYDFKVEYYYTSIVIVWFTIVLTIYFLETYIHWIIVFYWLYWTFKIQWWMWWTDDYWEFVDYVIWVEYRNSIYNWIFVYYVPTLVLPNLYYFNIVEEVYTESEFTITIKVKDWAGNLVDPDNFDITWGSDSVSASKISPGTYNIVLDARTVNPGDPGIWLNITATGLGFADSEIDVELAVDPDVIDKGDGGGSGDDDDDGGGGGGGDGGDGRGGGNIVGGMVSFLLSPIGLIAIGGSTVAGVAVVAVVLYFTKRKKR